MAQASRGNAGAEAGGHAGKGEVCGGGCGDGTDAAGLNTGFIQQTRPAGWGNLSSGDYNMDTAVSKSTTRATGHGTSTAQTMLLGLRDIPTISIATSLSAL